MTADGATVKGQRLQRLRCSCATHSPCIESILEFFNSVIRALLSWFGVTESPRRTPATDIQVAAWGAPAPAYCRSPQQVIVRDDEPTACLSIRRIAAAVPRACV